ncbi:hypothetical protein PC39_11869 [Salinisphaera sp. PC39]|uniref:hypothetical protein n=1 Tax=Salinisphaera sp. PC39 TaxID=1304156 RepID=UPI0033407605
MRHLVGAILIGLGAAFAAGCNGGAANAPEPADGGDRQPGEYLVQLATAETDPAVIRETYGDLGIEKLAALATRRPIHLLRVARDPGPDAMSSRAAGVDAIVHVQPNFGYSTQDGGSDADTSRGMGAHGTAE